MLQNLLYLPINSIGYPRIKKLQRDNLWHAYNEPINIYSVCLVQNNNQSGLVQLFSNPPKKLDFSIIAEQTSSSIRLFTHQSGTCQMNPPMLILFCYCSIVRPISYINYMINAFDKARLMPESTIYLLGVNMQDRFGHEVLHRLVQQL